MTVPISENTLLDIKANANTVQVGWIQGADGRWWYRHADGSYTVNNWELIDGKWYFFDGDGWMKTGWIQWAGGWYYLEPSGSMKTGWLYWENNWYYLNANGLMQIGWLKENEKWYFLASNGSMVTGYRRLGGIDYHFEANGQLSYDASIVAAIYTKQYGDINTLQDGNLAKSILQSKYVIEKYDNFTKNSFVGRNGKVNTPNLNRGIFYYSGHGYKYGYGLALGNGSGISPQELSNMEMNNTKVALFFACYGGVIDSRSGKSLVTAAVASGAKAAYGYRVASDVFLDRAVTKKLLESLMQGMRFDEAISRTQRIYEKYAPLHGNNLALAGDISIRVNDTYTIKDTEALDVPEGFVETSNEDGISTYKRFYNGRETTDKIVYDHNYMQYLVRRNVLDESTFLSIDLNHIEENKKKLSETGELSKYTSTFEVVTMVGGKSTVVLVGGREIEGMLTYDCIDLMTNTIVNEEIDLAEDIF